MMYGTAFDQITESRHRVGRIQKRGYQMPGLSAPAYTGSAWIRDVSTSNLVSKYGTISRDAWPRLPDLAVYNVADQTVSADGKFSYIHLITNNGSTVDLTIALQPSTSRGNTFYNPVLYSYKITDPPKPQILPGGDVRTPNTPPVVVPELQPVIVNNTNRGTVAPTAAPNAPAPDFMTPFPPLDPGFSYVISEGETMNNAPGGNIDLFRASAYVVGQSVPYIVSRGLYNGVPSIVVSTTADTVAIPVGEMNDRWEYKKEQVWGPATDRIYFRTTLRNLTRNGAPIIYDYNVKGGGSSGIIETLQKVQIQDVARGITAVGTYGYSEAARAGAKEAGVDEKLIDDITLGYAIASAAVLGYGAAVILMAPTTAAAAAAPVAGEAVAATTAGTTAAATAGTTAAATTTATGAATAIGGAVLKTAGGAILGVGANAVKTGIEELTGQGPADGTQGEYALIPETVPVAPTVEPQKVSPMLLVAGVAFAAYQLFKNK